MYYPLWNPLSAKVSHLISEDEVLHEEGAPGSSCQGGQLVTHRGPSASGELVGSLKLKTGICTNVKTLKLEIF